MPRAARTYWSLALLLAALAALGQILWEQLGRPGRYVAASRLEVRCGAANEKDLDPAGVTWSLDLERGFDGVLSRASRLLGGEAAGGDALDPDFALALRAAATSKDTTSLSSVPLAPRVGLTSLDGSTVVFRAEARSSELARAIAWATALAAREWFEERTGSALVDERADLRERESALETELDRAIQERLEFSRRVGVVDIGRHTELLKRLILEIDEEASRLEIQRLDLARLIRERQVNAGAAEAAASTAPADTTAAGNAPERLEGVREELLRARLEYEVQTPALTSQHPRMLKLQKKILDLESLLTKADGENPGGKTDPVLLETHRTLSLKLDTLAKKKDALTQEFNRLSGLRPEIDRIEKSVAVVESRLGATRDRLGDVKWQLSRLEKLGRVQAPTSATALPRPLVGRGWTLLFALGGFLFGLALALCLPRRDTRLRGAQQTQAFLDLPVIACIPPMSRRECASPENVENRLVREGASTLATITRTVARELDFKIFSVSSAKIGEGKSTVAIHFAVALARKGFQVVLVDANLRRPALHASLGLDNETGLSSLLESGVLDEAGSAGEGEESEEGSRSDIVESIEGALRPALFENLHVLTAGPTSEFPEAIVAGRTMETLLDTLATMFDFVIVDTPSVEQRGEALEPVRLSEACVMVVAAGRCQLKEAERAKQLFSDVQTSILGIVLNRYSGEVPSRVPAASALAGSRKESVEAPA